MASLKTGDTLIDFTLPATDGKDYNARTMLAAAKALVVVFMCNHCPYVKAWEDRINAIARDYAGQGVRMLGISANDVIAYPADSFEKMAERAREKGFVFPYLYDESQEVARVYGAQRTPELFIFDASGKLRYHGAPDDNYDDEARRYWKRSDGASGDNQDDEDTIKQHYARQALDAILVGGIVTEPETPPVGCSIKWKSA